MYMLEYIAIVSREGGQIIKIEILINGERVVGYINLLTHQTHKKFILIITFLTHKHDQMESNVY